MRAAGGFTMLELLVAMSIGVGMLVLLCSFAAAVRGAARVGGDRSDQHQRVRALADALVASLDRAGAGARTGTGRGSLVKFLPPIVPLDSTGLVVLGAAGDAPVAALAADAPSDAGTLELEYAAGCQAPCGLSDGAALLVFDTHGDFDVFTVTDVTGTVAAVRRHPTGTGGAYPRGSPALRIEPRMHVFDAGSLELRTSDGLGPSFPVVDGVVDLSFEYFGEAQPPTLPGAPAGRANCLFDAAGMASSGMAVLAGRGGTFAHLPLEMFADGPWCGTGPNPFDADLLRIRAVGVTARVQTGSAALRGTNARWFRVPGTSRESASQVRDLTFRARLTPPNLVRASVR
jgi:hypothetical protein